jgi:hypothetical protein
MKRKRNIRPAVTASDSSEWLLFMPSCIRAKVAATANSVSHEIWRAHSYSKRQPDCGHCATTDGAHNGKVVRYDFQGFESMQHSARARGLR